MTKSRKFDLLRQGYKNPIIISTSLVMLSALIWVGIAPVYAPPPSNVTIAHPDIHLPWETAMTPANDTTGLTGSVFVSVVDLDDHGVTPVNPFPDQIAVKNERAVPTNFKGSSDGTLVYLTPGRYDIQAKGYSGLHIIPSSGCSGTIESGEIKACNIIYRGTLLR